VGNTRPPPGLIAYLAGPESGYLTGATINIDGGYTV
jgi:3-oxoacyl-[acyl-carrier protein] reductase